MMRFRKLAFAMLAMVMSTGMTVHAEIKAGDDAPEFELTGSDGKIYKMSELKGRKAVVIAWYPKAFTGG